MKEKAEKAKQMQHKQKAVGEKIKRRRGEGDEESEG